MLTNKKTSAGVKAEMDSEIYYVDYAYMSALFAEQPGTLTFVDRLTFIDQSFF